MTKKFFTFSSLSAFLFVSFFTVGSSWASDEEIAKELTVLLKSSRAVLVQNKPLIKDPKGAGISADKFMEITFQNYEKATGKKFKIADGDKGKAQKLLTDSIKQTVADVVAGKDTQLDPQGRFLPAIFARKAASRFSSDSGGKMYLKLTTRDDYLVNKSNKADDWEKSVIQDKFMKAGWEKGKTYSEMAEHGGKKAYRLILPEYYKEGCMNCHGGDAGRKIHASKKPGNLGELGGAISVAIYK